MTEQEMRDAKVPWPKTIEELTDYINILSKEHDDYGKAVYIMSKAATATFYYMSHVVGASGFQASVADLDILRRTRSIESPFAIITGEDMLYPQYDIIGKVKEYLTEWETWASKKAKKNMEENEQGNVHPNVWKRWEELAAKILEPGKEYLAAPNWRMRCISDLRMEDEGEYSVVMERYSKVKGWKGPFYYKKDGTHKYEEHNIIGPWNPKPVVDWSLYSKWTKAVAMDKDGLWYGYTEIPTKLSATWELQYSMTGIPPEYAPKNADGTPWTGNWEDSLVVREED